MAHNKNDYFLLMEEQAKICVDASELLEQILCNYSTDSIGAQREQMHAIEHKADDLQHEILSKLSSEFITPIDQEDIFQLVQIIDDVTDALDEVVLELYMYCVEEMPIFTTEIVKIVVRCVTALANAVKELKSFKKPKNLKSLLVEVNSIESEADTKFEEALHTLFSSDTPYKVLIGNKAIYESLENCCDLCETAADLIEQIVIKNT